MDLQTILIHKTVFYFLETFPMFKLNQVGIYGVGTTKQFKSVYKI